LIASVNLRLIAETFNLLAIALVAATFVGCATQNERTITKIEVDAAIKSDLPWNPQDGQVITTWADRETSTMSTRYGTEVAVGSARASGDAPAYPSGTRIALVTWSQREDDRWFGANIPATVQSVEFVTVKNGPANNAECLYQRFQGSLLHQTAADEELVPHGRIAYLLSQRAATMP
jgi:hypothetical protein